MKTVLYIEASPRKQISATIEVARVFLETLKQQFPSVHVDKIDLWDFELPEFDGAALHAKYAGLAGNTRSKEQQTAWNEITALGERFKAADLLIFAVPMWNFGIPYKLKHLIDVVSQKDVLFTFDERGMLGMMNDTRAVCIYGRGMDFSAEGATPAAVWDFQKAYLEIWLRSVGVTKVDSIVMEKTLFGTEVDRLVRAGAAQEAKLLAITPAIKA